LKDYNQKFFMTNTSEEQNKEQNEKQESVEATELDEQLREIDEQFAKAYEKSETPNEPID
jgi:hypothetical protein